MHALRLAQATSLLLVLSATLVDLPAQKKGGGSTPPPDPAIAIVQTSGNRGYLKVMNSDGSNLRTVLQLTANGSGPMYRPAISPDGTQIAFAWDPNGVRGIYVVNVDGTGLRRVVAISTSLVVARCAWSPAPAPDGNAKLAFPDTANGPEEIFVVNLDGSGLRQLTFNTTGESNPTWSRDATRLAFTRNRALIVATLGLVGGQLAITGESDLTAAAGSPLQANLGLALPAWANTGDVLVVSAMTADSGGNYDLWLVNPLVSSLPLRITHTPGSNEVFCTFGLDDTRVYFGHGLVEACNLDGSGRVTIQSNAMAPSHRRR